MAKVLRLTSNGNYKLKAHIFKRASISLVIVSGDVGAATIKLVLPDGVGGWIDVVNGAITAGSQHVVTHGQALHPYINIVSADAATVINVQVSGVQ